MCQKCAWLFATTTTTVISFFPLTDCERFSQSDFHENAHPIRNTFTVKLHEREIELCECEMYQILDKEDEERELIVDMVEEKKKLSEIICTNNNMMYKYLFLYVLLYRSSNSTY